MILVSRYLPELAHPYDKLASHAEIVIASLAGGKAPVNQMSVETRTDKVSQRFWRNSSSLWEETEKLEKFLGRAKDFDAILIVGGVGRKDSKAINAILLFTNVFVCHV